MEENILNTLQLFLKTARQSRDVEGMRVFQTIIGDLQRINKDFINKEQLLAYTKAQIKSIEKTIDQAEKLNKPYEPDQIYLDVLSGLEFEYSPPQLSETLIRKYFAELVRLNPNINKGMMMKAIKEEFAGCYDGKLAAKIAGEFH